MSRGTIIELAMINTDLLCQLCRAATNGKARLGLAVEMNVISKVG